MLAINIRMLSHQTYLSRKYQLAFPYFPPLMMQKGYISQEHLPMVSVNTLKHEKRKK